MSLRQRSIRRAAAFLWAVVLVGCGGGESGNAGSSSASASPPAARSGIVLEEGAIFLDGARIDDVFEMSGPIQTLHHALRARREAWKASNPNMAFPGRIEVELPEAVSCIAALGVLQTCSDAGFPNLSLQIGGLPRELGLLSSQLTSPNSTMAHLWFRADGTVEIRRRRCDPAYDVVPMKDVFAPLRRLLPQARLGGARVGCDGAVPFKAIAVVLDEHALGKPEFPMALGFYEPCVRKAELAPLPASELGKLAMTFEVTEDKGGLGAAAIKKAIDGVHDRLLGCHAAARKAKPDLSDSLALELEISDKGRPVSSGATMFEIADQLEECVEIEAFGLVVDPAPSAFVKLSLRLTFGAKKQR